MSESEIIIPVSSISRKSSSGSVEKSTQVDRKNVEVSLSKFLRRAASSIGSFSICFSPIAA